MKISPHTIRVAGAAVATIALALAPLAPAQASTPSWGVWTDLAPAEADAPGSISFGNSSFPNATFAMSGQYDPLETGVDTVYMSDEYFTADTPIGAVFGANGPQTSDGSANFYLVESTSNNSDEAILTVTFASPTTAGNLAFAVSDLDSDHVTVTATDGNDAAATGDQIIGSASPSSFNFCDVSAPPAACGSDTVGPLVTIGATDVLAAGVESGTDGSTAWFQPSVAISTVTFTFSTDDGSGSGSRYWFAQKDTAALPDTGASASTMMGMFGVGSAMLAAGAMFILRRRQV